MTVDVAAPVSPDAVEVYREVDYDTSRFRARRRTTCKTCGTPLVLFYSSFPMATGPFDEQDDAERRRAFAEEATAALAVAMGWKRLCDRCKAVVAGRAVAPGPAPTDAEVEIVDDEGPSSLEQVRSFVAWLQGGPGDPGDATPPAYRQQPTLDAERAWSVVYYLQETLHALPDDIERCDRCKELFDYGQGGACVDAVSLQDMDSEMVPEYIEYQGTILCPDCLAVCTRAVETDDGTGQ